MTIAIILVTLATVGDNFRRVVRRALGGVLLALATLANALLLRLGRRPRW